MKNHRKIFLFITLHIKLCWSKAFRIMFDKINGFIRTYDGNRYLVLYGLEKYDAIYNRYKISYKSRKQPLVFLIITQKS